LSWAGKEILIKAIAQAVPTFAMGCFDMTKTLCDQISAMICRNWWNQQEGKHKIHWLSWEVMIKLNKGEGGGGGGGVGGGEGGGGGGGGGGVLVLGITRIQYCQIPCALKL